MKLPEPSQKFIKEILKKYSVEGGHELNENLLKLFQTFNNDKNKFHVLIKVAALNKIYSTAITNINPVAEKIINITNTDLDLNTINEYVYFVDEISKIKWTNNDGKSFKRNNLSFASKYVHFLSGHKTPIYDSYIWIIIKGYLGQENKQKPSFKNPKNFNEFYSTFIKFKKDLKLDDYTNYDIDKFLWQYGKSLIEKIKTELPKGATLSHAKSELKKRIKNNT
ncbi:hypothetical protein JBL43_10730 [Aureibaculum sp. A20]|uniref:Restriction endonuclease n=1 Tax=Aureibaculum flavum TaxID=2795986 RepID=A0ABS0WRW5_9FLAO|nr:hypothetical protein [Aureibaculum flavum]MBJ2174713.1 hypothetical protein [Aureibaculum flavum]